MQHLSLQIESRKQKKLRRRTWLLGLLLTMLLLILPTASHGEDVAGAVADSVMVPTSLLVEARETIDDLDFQLEVADSTLVAQKDYYIELLALKDQRITILEDTVKDALGSPTKTLMEKIVWGLAGYGLRTAVE